MPIRTLPLVVAFCAGALAASAQEGADPLALLPETEALCAAAPDSPDCQFARTRLLAALPAVIAEAGNSRDRAAFIDLVRLFLTHEAPQVRTSALYALAKLAPDASDTPAIRAALFDPAAHVRAAAWAAAGQSGDPGAQALVSRVPVRPKGGGGYGPDPEPFDPAALGVPMPEGAAYLWLTAGLREEGQLQFLTDAAPAGVLAHFAPFAAGPPLPPEAASAAYPDSAFLFGDFQQPGVFGDPQVLVLPATGDIAARMVVVYDDIVLGRTGFALVQEFRRPIATPAPPVAEEPDPFAHAETDPDLAGAGLATLLDIDPAAPEEETALYLAILSARGFGAEDYLTLFPEGAYADRMRAIVAGPRLILDGFSVPDTGTITARFQNLPPGHEAYVQILSIAKDHALEDNTLVPDAATGQAIFVLDGQLDPGPHLIEARIGPPGAAPEVVLVQDIMVVAARAELTLAATEFVPGAPIEVGFAGMAGGSRDYLAIARADSPPDSYVSYRYTEGARDGTATLTAPDQPGAYELRAFFNEDSSLVRASLPFTVTGTAPITMPQPQAPDVDTPDPQVTVTPPASTGSVALTLESATVLPGGSVRFSWAGMSGATQDFISTAEAGSPPEAYLRYSYTSGAAAGSGSLMAPFREGAYELRAIFASDTKTLQAVLPFTVRTEVVLSLPKTVFAPGEGMIITYSGMAGESQDYVATAQAGSPPDSYLAYSYTLGAREGSLSLKAPNAPGDYELRAVLQSGGGQIKASLPFTVSATP